MEDDEAWLYGEDQATEPQAPKDETQAKVSTVTWYYYFWNGFLNKFTEGFNNVYFAFLLA